MNSVEVAAIISAVAVLVGSFGAYLASNRQVTAIKEEAEKQRRHDSEELRLEREAADSRSRDERLHRDRVEAYQAITRYSMRASELAAWHRTWIEHRELTPEPSLSAVLDDAARGTALLFASEEATTKLRDLSNTVNVLRYAKAGIESGEPTSRMQLGSTLKKACDKVEKQAIELMELARQGVNPAEP